MDTILAAECDVFKVTWLGVYGGRGPTELAREFGCNVSSIHGWLKAADRAAAPGDGRSAAAEPAKPLGANALQELVELRRRLKQEHMERDIVAKATAWFAGKSEKTFATSMNS